jgi:hypothetical protein
MTRTVFGAAMLAVLLTSSARAEVLIYTGTIQHLATSELPSVQKRKAYVVFDQFQKEFAVLSWGKDIIGKRHDVPISTFLDYLTFPRSDGMDEDGYAFATAQATLGTPGGGGYRGIFIHGARVPLVVSVTGNVKNIQPRAKTLTGVIAGSAVGLLGALSNYDGLTLKYDEKLTVEANGGNSSVDVAMAHLVGLVEAMGYVSK